METNGSLANPKKDVSIVTVSVHCVYQSFGTKTECSSFIHLFLMPNFSETTFSLIV